MTASLQGRLRGTGGAAQPGKHWAGWSRGCGGELDTDPWKDGGDDKHRTVSTGPDPGRGVALWREFSLQ